MEIEEKMLCKFIVQEGSGFELFLFGIRNTSSLFTGKFLAKWSVSYNTYRTFFLQGAGVVEVLSLKEVRDDEEKLT